MEIRVLGPVGLRDDGAEVPVGGPRQRRLLAALVLDAGKTVSVDRLIDVVWAGEPPPDGASKTLRTYVSRLRQTLGDGHVRTDEPGYSLVVEPDLIDARRFERLLRTARSRQSAGDSEAALAQLDEALAQWHGHAYDEFASEAWAWAEAARLEELRLLAREERADSLIATGDTATAVVELERLAAEVPLRDHAYRALMLALYRAGRQADALRAFQAHRQYLADEVGLDPSPELVELEQMIAMRDPRLDEVAPPRALRGYRLGEKLGEGRFGVVFRALQPGVDRDVAIKMIHADLADDPAFVRRFESEAQLVARLEHRCIVPLYDYWREPGGAYLVMRWMRGGTLEDRLASGPLSLSETVEVVEQVGGALAIAHHAGVIHRDVKPGNVLLDEEGSAYLSDFGIALASGQLSSNVDELRSAGSPAYASPEQMTGAEITERSDICSLGIVIYELLTGRLPYEAQTATGLIGEKLARPLPSVSAQRAGLPTELDLVVQRATMPQAADRYANVVELVDALRAAAAAPAQSTTTDAMDERSRTPTRAAVATVASTPLPVVNPYKGLRPFDEADAADFFGRARMVDQVVDRLRSGARFVAVIGPSGSGKSSLVRAGVLPALRSGALAASDGWFVTTMAPGAHPYEELESALLRVAINPPPTLLEQLRSGERGFIRAAQRTLPGDSTELVLLIDQFEELFTQADQAEAERESFLSALAATVGDASARVRVLVTIRADYFDRPLANASIGELMATSNIAITPLTPEELERAIAGPAERSGVRLEAGLLATIVRDVADRPASLPFLQYCLTELYDRRDGLMMTLDAYRDLGGVSGALGRRAEDIYENLGAEDKPAARELFTRLVTPGEGEADTRRRARRAQLTALPVGPDAMDEVIDRFGAQRLLTFDRDPATREPTVEVAHEALLAAWPRLAGWIDEDREGLAVLRRLSEATDAWNAAGHQDSDLLRGPRLETAETWASANPDRLSIDERSFVQASISARDAAQKRDHRSRRRLHRLVAGIAVALVLALVAGAVAIQKASDAERQRAAAQQVARDATISRMAFQARALADSNSPQALLLAVEAERLRSDPDTLGALQVALLAQPEVLRTLDVGTRLANFAVNDDGESATAGTFDGRVLTVDTHTGGITDQWKVGESAVWALPLAQGRTLAHQLGTGRLIVRDPDGSTRVLVDDGVVFELMKGVPFSEYVDTEGRSVIAATTTSGIRILTSDGDVVADGLGPGAPVISGDGRRLAIASGYENLVAPTTITVIDLATGAVVLEPMTVPLPRTPRVNRSGDRLVVAGASAEGAPPLLIDLATGAKVELPFEPGDLAQAAFSIDGSLVATVGDLGLYRVFRTADGSQVGSTVVGPSGFKVSVGFSPDNAEVFVAGRDGSVVVYGVGGHTKLARPLRVAGRLGLYSPDSSLIALAGSSRDTLHLIDADSLQVRHTLHLDQPFPEIGGLYFAFSPDEEELAIGTVATTDRSAAIEVFSVTTGEHLRRLELAGIGSAGPPVAWSADGRTLLVAAFDQLFLIDADNGAVRRQVSLPMAFPLLAFFDEHGGSVVTGADVELSGKTVVFDATGEQIRAFDGVGWLSGSELVLANQYESEVRILDWESGQQLETLRAAPGLLRAEVLPSGMGVAYSQSNDVTLWDVESGRVIGRSFLPSNSRQSNTGTDPTGTQLIAPGDPAMVWDLDPAVWRERACEAAGRNLTQAEWTEFLPRGERYHVTCPQYPAGA